MKEILLNAIAHYGADSQTFMLFEEMAELQKEICKSRRGEDNRRFIADEIADVEIMLAQMKIIYDCAELVEERRGYKLRRLKERLGARC